jgi:hypothetical protein
MLLLPEGVANFSRWKVLLKEGEERDQIEI